MRKKIILLFAQGLLFTCAHAQSSDANRLNTQGIAITRFYNTTPPVANATWTDIRGNFLMSAGDRGQGIFNHVWKYDKAANNWALADKETTEKLLKVRGKTDPSVASPGSQIVTLYWKDNDGNLWQMGNVQNGSGPEKIASLWQQGHECEDADKQGTISCYQSLPVTVMYK